MLTHTEPFDPNSKGRGIRYSRRCDPCVNAFMDKDAGNIRRLCGLGRNKVMREHNRGTGLIKLAAHLGVGTNGEGANVASELPKLSRAVGGEDLEPTLKYSL